MAVIFTGGEVLLYLIYKVARRDFFWFPAIDGLLGVISSFLEKVSVKIIMDYTGCLHFRHPYELGGFFFCFSMLWAQVSDVRRTIKFSKLINAAHRYSRSSRCSSLTARRT